MENKTVSVIIPVYNTGKQLENCIDSLLKQTYKDLEIILVNDASADESGAICQRYASENSSLFKYIEHKENKGQSTTRNDGVRAASGNWMILLDSDDYLSEDALEKMVEVSERDNVDIVLANFKTFNDQGIERTFTIELPEGTYTTRELVSHFYDVIAMNMLSCIGTKLYRMDFVRNRKKETPDTTITNYDIAFILDALVAAPKLSYLNKVVYIYYQREGSITHSYRKNMYKGFIQARRELLPLLQNCGCYEQKKLDYHIVVYGVISNSLGQEVRYGRGYKSFKQVFTEITNNPNTAETVKVICENDQPKNRKALMHFVKGGNCILAYLMFYVHTHILKRR